MHTIPEMMAQAKTHYLQGCPHQSEQLYRQVIHLAPTLPELWRVWYLLGVACHAQAKFGEAIAHFRQSVRLNPNSWHTFNHLGVALAAVSESIDAEASFRRALALGGDTAELHSNLAHSLLAQGKYDEAEEVFNRVLGMQPRDLRLYLRLAQALFRQKKTGDALAVYERADAVAPNLPFVHSAWGSLLIDLGRTEEAIRHFHAALRVSPDHSPAWASLCDLAGENGYSFSPDEVAKLRKMAAEPGRPSVDRIRFHFVMGKILEKRGEYDEAFGYFRQGNDLISNNLELAGKAFNPDLHSRQIDELIAAFSPAFFQRMAGFGNPSEKPVFIVGVPRSGTSLVNQIVAAHPQAGTVGELIEMQMIATELPRHAPGASLAEVLSRLDPSTVLALAGRYLRRLEQIGGPGVRIADKMPENYYHLGLIATLFPKARIVHCRRSAEDTCVSCYTNHFSDVRFSTTLASLGRYYRVYERLMAHWRAVLPAAMFEIQYEDLVSRPEAVIRGLIAFCGLEWNDRCLAFHKVQGAVHTVSRMQIRQPIYTRAVERWRRYAAHLGPLLEALAQG